MKEVRGLSLPRPRPPSLSQDSTSQVAGAALFPSDAPGGAGGRMRRSSGTIDPFWVAKADFTFSRSMSSPSCSSSRPWTVSTTAAGSGKSSVYTASPRPATRQAFAGVAPVSTRHNERVARLATLELRAGNVQGSPTSRGAASPQAASSPISPALALDPGFRLEDFAGEAESVEQEVKDMLHKIRLEHLLEAGNRSPEAGTEEDLAMQRQLQMQRLREMKKKRNAKDPRLKVESRLQHAHEFGAPPGSQAALPMVRIQATGFKGKEAIDLVDVSVLRSRCKGMSQGETGIHKMLETMSKEDRMRAALNYSRSSADSAADSNPYSLLERPEKGISLTERHQRAYFQHKAAKFDGMLRKLSCMRGSASECSLERFEALAKSVLKTVDVNDVVNKIGSYGASRSQPLVERMALLPDRSFELGKELAAAVAVSRVPRAIEAQEYRELQALLSTEGRGAKGKSAAEQERKRLRIRKLMRAFRGVSRSLTVYFRHMKLTNMVDGIRQFLQGLASIGKKVQIKKGCQALVTTVCVMQRHARRYLFWRKRRIREMENRWKMVEDAYLEEHFKHVLAELQKQEEAQKNRQKARGRNGSNLGPTTAIDWKRFRLPEEERQEIISRLFTVGIWKYVGAHDKLQTSAIVSEPSQAPMALNLLDVLADEEQDPMKFWQLSETAILENIAIAARALRGSDILCEHPANKEPSPSNPIGELSERVQRCSPELAMLTASAEMGTSSVAAALAMQQLHAERAASKKDSEQHGYGQFAGEEVELPGPEFHGWGID
eukprot:TRINITY_DN91522_c0_g1_i1.p1 TRINITY_DN91522_c0_g1~~TRINITY_DN91522_c0_g1_i1.p1  ORF type:complete len:777 (-),score=166.78 TRINITY_DN91522_c0_g1_i1:264-2594(-)